MKKIRWLMYGRHLPESIADRMVAAYKPDKEETMPERRDAQTTIYYKDQRRAMKVVYKKLTDDYNIYVAD